MPCGPTVTLVALRVVLQLVKTSDAELLTVSDPRYGVTADTVTSSEAVEIMTSSPASGVPLGIQLLPVDQAPQLET